MGKSPVRAVWIFEDQFGAEVDKDIDPKVIVVEWLNYVGVGVEQCTAAELKALIASTRYCPLFSVVKADWDIDPDDCGGWHSDASGKRVKHAWFLDKKLIYDIEDRLHESSKLERDEATQALRVLADVNDAANS